MFKITKTRTCPYHPQSDGLIERTFRTIKPLLASVAHDKNISWVEAIPYVELGLRITKQSTTKHSPYKIMFGRDMILGEQNATWVETGTQNSIDEMHKVVRMNIQKATQKQTEYYNKNTYRNNINIGDKVLIQNHLYKFPLQKYFGPYRVEKIINNSTYEVVDELTGQKFQRHYNQIKLFSEDRRSDKRMSTSIESFSNTSNEQPPRRSRRTIRPPDRFF